jgi:GNAT superfamily N-acetyltransferase
MLEYEKLQEYQIGPELDLELRALLKLNFPQYEDRRYYKQLPRFRYLARFNGELIGHLGIEHRMIKLGDTPHSIFGAIDLCTKEEYRNQGIASELLAQLGREAASYGIDFLVCFADDHRLYERDGFQRTDNVVRWLKIHDHESIGIGEENLGSILLVKQIGNTPWRGGLLVDLLGYLF